MTNVTTPKFAPQATVRVKKDACDRMLIPGETLEIMCVYEGDRINGPFRDSPPGTIYLAMSADDYIRYPHEDDLEPVS